MLTRLIYYSENSPTISLDELRKILKVASNHNAQKGITGILYHDERFFLQVLEGDRTKLNVLYNRIVQDPRHNNPVLVKVSQVDSRMFGKWSMLYVNEVNIDYTEILKHFPRAEFNPLEMSDQDLELFALNIKLKRKKTALESQ